MSRRSSLTHTACHYMVVLSGPSLADSLLPWKLPSIKFSGKFGGSQETATLWFCIKLHILTVFSTDMYIYLTVFQERPVSQTPICFKTPLLYSTTMCLPQSAAITYCAHKYVKLYFEEDNTCADFARHLHLIISSLRWHGSLSAKINKNANLGYSHDRGLS